MSLKNEIPKEMILVSYPSFTDLQPGESKYIKIGIFDSTDDLIEILNDNRLKSYFGSSSTDDLLNILKIEKVTYFRTVKTYRKEGLDDILS
jgi:hypothetical protein